MHIPDPWYRLDNAGKIFTSVASDKMTTVHRISVSLKQPVKITPLRNALKNIIVRFPYFRVYLHKGFFWYYLEETDRIPVILPDTRSPCRKIDIKRKGTFLFRIKAYNKRIAVEFSHILTDGTGSLTFLKALITEYVYQAFGPYDKSTGPEESTYGIFRPGQKPDPEESEDSFIKHYNRDAPRPVKMTRAFHLPYKREAPGIYNILTGIMPLEKISGISKEKKVTINDLMVSVLLAAFQEVYFRHHQSGFRKPAFPIRVIVPINLRRLFPSRTMRNFTLYTAPDINPALGKYSFDEILSRVHYLILLGNNRKSVQPDMARNVRGERNLIVRLIPRFIKDILLNTIFNAVGETPNTSSISNLGIVNLPDRIAEHIEGFDFIPAPGPKTKCNCGLISFNGKIFISFGRNIREAEIEKHFFNILMKMGIPLKILTN